MKEQRAFRWSLAKFLERLSHDYQNVANKSLRVKLKSLLMKSCYNDNAAF